MTNITSLKPEIDALKASGLLDDGLYPETQWLQLANTETLYAEDQVTSASFIAIRLFLALSADKVDISLAEVFELVENAVLNNRDCVTPEFVEDIAVFDWSLLWMASSDITEAICSLTGHNGDDDWYFDDLHCTRRLFAATSLKTADLIISSFKQITGNPNATQVLLKSFAAGESGQQAVTRMFAGANPLTVVEE